MQHYRACVKILFLCIALISETHHVFAGESTGKIVEIKSVRNQSYQPIHGLTDQLKVQRSAIGNWSETHEGLSLFQGDLLQILKYTRAKVRINYRDHQGEFVLSSDTPNGPKNDALYKINQGVDRLRGLELILVRGTLLVDWAHGQLSVVAANIPTLFLGTKVLFVVREDGEVGYLFLISGLITFPAHPGITVFPQQVVRLKTGEVPEIVSLNSASIKKLNEFTQFNMKTIWSGSKAFWQKPSFYVPAAAVLVASGFAVVFSGDDHNKITGNVTINIP